MYAVSFDRSSRLSPVLSESRKSSGDTVKLKRREREREREREDRRVSKIEEKEAQEKGARKGGITGKEIVCGRSSQLIKLKHKRKCKQSTINIDRSIEEEKKVGFGGEP